jgi:repressor LexA
MEYPNNLLACRTAARLSQMKVAKALDVSQSEYSRMELGRRQVGGHADKLAEIFGVTTDKLLEFHGSKLETAPPENGYVATKLPIFGRRVVGKYCMIEFDQEPVEMTDKPASLASSKDAYGVYVPGESMEPRVKTGDLLYVEPHQPVRKNDLVVVGYGDDGLREIMEYLGYEDGKICLCRTNPPDRILVEQDDVTTMERVSGVKFL